MHKKLLEIERELEEKRTIHNDYVKNESIGNMTLIILSSDELLEIGKEQLVSSIERYKEITLGKWEGKSCIFYCWFDDMSRQIRFSCISKKHVKLPFKCEIRERESVSDIVDIAYRYLDDDYFNNNIHLLDIYILEKTE